MNEHLYRSDTETESPEVGVLLADHFRRPFGFQGHRSKGTGDWLIVYTIHGSGSFRVDREVHVCGAGDVVILSPGVPHHYASNEAGEWDILWTHFVPLPDWMPWLALPRTEERLICLHLRGDEIRGRIEQTFHRLIRDASMSAPVNRELAKLALAEVLVLLYHYNGEQESDRVMDERISQVIRYLSEHLHLKHRLSDLAAMAGLSPSRFCHLMKEQTGDTLTERLTKMRLAKAARLLELTSRRINEIAFDVGFETAYYFSRLFTGHFGISPTAYRQRMWQRQKTSL
ncbi:helix-turn-helix domain-containing protein [Paenibacillus sacheonensis]|uniref:Helix-turn-helix domain-containing protein n=1 Tax=Paenibacillus sacheonensis TaxID=742054 RepID=A0A7X4YPV2_9BACL|nr:helix-turn-helix domain-containing protein [Paenibacillus sacheonensis]MBM7564851.1 AraC family transcriptional regulator of arabinose operon [Paenibacillus sacheonensis]NBC69399.1 helix-turn-helix domain-containing protein [Paenibacillus sacheonensis]